MNITTLTLLFSFEAALKQSVLYKAIIEINMPWLEKLCVMFQVINFSSGTIAGFIAMVGVLSIIAQVQTFSSRRSFMRWYMI